MQSPTHLVSECASLFNQARCFPGAFSPDSASCRFLLELEHRMEENIVISDVCDIVYRYAAEHFSVYITYVSNQTYQERTYKQLL